MTGNPLATAVQVELGKHKAVAAAVSSIVGLAALIAASGLLHGTAQAVAEGIIGLAAAGGITGAVYATPTTATLTGPTSTVTPGPGDVSAL